MAEEESRKQLNIRLPPELVMEVKKAALGTKIYKAASKALGFWLYITKNIGLKETMQIVEETYALALLKAARNDLSHLGFNTSKLDELIHEVESFLVGASSEGKVKSKNERD